MVNLFQDKNTQGWHAKLDSGSICVLSFSMVSVPCMVAGFCDGARVFEVWHSHIDIHDRCVIVTLILLLLLESL